MTYSMKLENKLDGASNFRAWKTRIDLILAKNKVLDIVKGNIMKPEFEEGKEKEPQNIAAMEKFKDVDINAMSTIVDSIKDHLIPYISHLDSSKKMYDVLTNLFSVRNIGQVMSMKNELCDMKMNKRQHNIIFCEDLSVKRSNTSYWRDHFKKGIGEHSTQWSSQDVGCIFRKHEHKEGVSDI
jgi:hypothetical protein